MSEYVGLVKGKLHNRREISEYYCGSCGYPVTDHDSYCRECGGALHEGMAETLSDEYKRGYEDGLHANTKAAFSAAKQAVAAILGDKAELTELLNEFERECFMLRVEASETRAKDDVVHQSYERIRDELARRIAVTLGSDTCQNVWNVELNGRLRFQCSECGSVSLEITPIFCPSCGRKVVNT